MTCILTLLLLIEEPINFASEIPVLEDRMALLSVVRHNTEKATKIYGLLLETCLAYKLAFAERIRRLLRQVVELRIDARVAGAGGD